MICVEEGEKTSLLAERVQRVQRLPALIYAEVLRGSACRIQDTARHQLRKREERG